MDLVEQIGRFAVKAAPGQYAGPGYEHLGHPGEVGGQGGQLPVGRRELPVRGQGPRPVPTRAGKYSGSRERAAGVTGHGPVVEVVGLKYFGPPRQGRGVVAKVRGRIGRGCAGQGGLEEKGVRMAGLFPEHGLTQLRGPGPFSPAKQGPGPGAAGLRSPGRQVRTVWRPSRRPRTSFRRRSCTRVCRFRARGSSGWTRFNPGGVFQAGVVIPGGPCKFGQSGQNPGRIRPLRP